MSYVDVGIEKNNVNKYLHHVIVFEQVLFCPKQSKMMLGNKLKFQTSTINNSNKSSNNLFTVMSNVGHVKFLSFETILLNTFAKILLHFECIHVTGEKM